MANKYEIVANMTSPGYTAIFNVDELTKTLILDTLAEVPKLVAAQIVKDHWQEIMAKVSQAEIATLISAAVGRQFADYLAEADARIQKAREVKDAVPEQADVKRSDH